MALNKDSLRPGKTIDGKKVNGPYATPTPPSTSGKAPFNFDFDAARRGWAATDDHTVFGPNATGLPTVSMSDLLARVQKFGPKPGDAANIPTSRMTPQQQYAGVPATAGTGIDDPTENLNGADVYAAEARKNMRSVMADYDKQVADIRQRYQLTETPEERRLLASQMNALGVQLRNAVTNINETFNTARDYTAWAGGQANNYLTDAAATSAKALRGTAAGTGGAYKAAINNMGGQVRASGANTGGALGALGSQLAAMASQAGAGYAAEAQMSHDEQAALAQAKYAELVANRIAAERAAMNAELSSVASDRAAVRMNTLDNIAQRRYDWLQNDHNAVLNDLPGATAADTTALSDDAMDARKAIIAGEVQRKLNLQDNVEWSSNINDETAPKVAGNPLTQYSPIFTDFAASARSQQEYAEMVAKLLEDNERMSAWVSFYGIDPMAWWNARPAGI